MKPTRTGLPDSVGNDGHETISSLRMVIRFSTGTIPYRPLSFCGPSMSRPSVLPSPENEWQLAQVCRSFITIWLLLSEILRIRQLISGIAAVASGLMNPFSSSDGISGTSR